MIIIGRWNVAYLENTRGSSEKNPLKDTKIH